MKHSPPLLSFPSPAAADLSAADYVRLLHPPGSRGKVSFVLNPGVDGATTRTYSLDVAPIIVDSLLDESTYLTLNRFNGPRRSDRLAQINALYLDLDVHRLPGSNQPYQHWADRFHDELDAKKLPRPTILTFTGRGLAASWLIDPLPAKAEPRWREGLRCLIGLFRHLGADSVCSDSSRIFRVPGTINPKSGHEVRTIDGTLRRYQFDDLADRIFSAADRPTRRQMTERKRKSSSEPASSEARGLSPRARFAMIQRDLDRIAAHWGGRVPEGWRNMYLHLVATCLTHTIAACDIEQQVSRIAMIATPDLSEREIAGIIKSAESQVQNGCSSTPALDRRLHYSGAKVAELLDISDDIARSLGLEQVFSDLERTRRKAAREMDRRQAAGAVSREDWLAQNSAAREKPWQLAGLSRTKWYELGLHQGDQAT